MKASITIARVKGGMSRASYRVTKIAGMITVMAEGREIRVNDTVSEKEAWAMSRISDYSVTVTG